MANLQPSLLLLYCGGTIGMRQNAHTSALQPQLTAEELVQLVPNLREEFHIETKTITMIDSTNMQPHHWSTIATTIQKEYHNYDGFVVIHGTDTMAYTASALSFALGNLGKPVVLTGSQVPPEILGSDAMNNLVHSCLVASMDLAEVAIVFGTSIVRGNRSLKVSESGREAFLSPVFPALGSIRLQPEITHPDVRRRHGGALEIQPQFAGNIPVIKLVPGLSPTVLESIASSGIDGLVLESFGPGGIPNEENSLLPVIKTILGRNIPVLVSTQCIYGTTRMYLYEVGQKAMNLGVIPTGDMTPEAAFVKLKWALGQRASSTEIMEIFSRSIAGEVTIGHISTHGTASY